MIGKLLHASVVQTMSFNVQAILRKLEFVFYDSGPAKRNAPPKTSSNQKPTSQQTPRKQSMDAVFIANGYETPSHSLAVPQNKAGLMASLQERYVPQLPKLSTEKGSMNGAN